MSTILAPGAPRHSANRVVLGLLHFIGYYVLLKRPGTRLARIAGFELTIRPTVYDPRYYRAPAYFAEFIGGLDLSGKQSLTWGQVRAFKPWRLLEQVHRGLWRSMLIPMLLLRRQPMLGQTDLSIAYFR